MAMVDLVDACYTALTEMKKQIKEERNKAGKVEKTTYSECICILLRETGRLKS